MNQLRGVAPIGEAQQQAITSTAKTGPVTWAFSLCIFVLPPDSSFATEADSYANPIASVRFAQVAKKIPFVQNRNRLLVR